MAQDPHVSSPPQNAELHNEPKQTETWRWTHTLALLLIVIAMTVVFKVFPSISKLSDWVLNLVLLTIFLAVAGQGVSGLLLGALIDERNKMSLSRLQLTLWTILILSALLTVALSNILSGVTEHPLAIGIPKEVWLLMGISTISLVGSPLIKNTKQEKEPAPAEREATIALLTKQAGIPTDRIQNKGQIVINTNPQDARLSDLFKGEETGNAANLDLAKIQMFFFTIILVIAYAGLLYAMFAHSDRKTTIENFPSVDQSMLALLGISHAGYLANKAVPHSQEA
jgi:hypothetical protein